MSPEAPRTLIRVDGSLAIGLGHVARMRTLAEALRARASRVALAVHRDATVARDLLVEHAFEVLDVESTPGTALDGKETLALAERHGASLLVVDGYAFGAPYLRSLRPSSLFVCYVDDLYAPVECCDAVLNNNIYADLARYAPPVPTASLMGPSYALLGSAFRMARRPVRPGQAKNLLVTFGGSDPTGQSRKVVRALSQVPPDPRLSVQIVVGRANPPELAQTLEADAAASPHAIRVAYGVNDMAALMGWTDFAITAGGSTCLELACVGVPSLVVAIADNQRAVATGFDARGLMRSLGWYEEVDETRVAHELVALRDDAEMREQMVTSQQAAVDGLGADRAAAALLGRARERQRASGPKS